METYRPNAMIWEEGAHFVVRLLDTGAAPEARATHSEMAKARGRVLIIEHNVDVAVVRGR